jgi:hypothetical protein
MHAYFRAHPQRIARRIDTPADALDRGSMPRLMAALDCGAKAHCYLIVEGDEAGARVTLNSQQIAQLAQVRGIAA